MVTDKPVKGWALKVSLSFFCAVLSVIFFMAQGLFAQDHPVAGPPEDEVPVRQPELIPWRTLVGMFQRRIEKNAANKDVRVSFLNTPYGKHRVEDLMAYTLSGTGAATIQMRDTVKQIIVPPEELYWMGRFLLQYNFADLPEEESDDPYSAEFRVSVRVDGEKRTLRLYNSRNDKSREIIWQYLYSFGLRLIQTAGLSDQNKAIMPVCRGVTGIQELDPDSDGLIDWLKLKLEFYSFKSGDFTLGFCGRKTNIFLAQGNTVYYAYVNAYLMRRNDLSLCDYSKLSLDMKPPHPKGPYVIDLGLLDAGYNDRGDLRSTPDLRGAGAAPLKFDVRVNQDVILEMTRAGHGEDRGVIRFSIKEIQPGKVIIGDDTESFAVTTRDPFFLHDIECMGCVLSLVKTENSSAALEVGWIFPDKEVIESKIRYFNEALVSDNYHGDKDQSRMSLDSALSCKEAVENAGGLETKIIFIAPAG